MTCIAIVKNRKGKLMIAGDRRDSWGWSYSQSMEVPKVNKKDNILIGATGDSGLCSLFVDDGGFEFPIKNVDNVHTYMYHVLKPAIFKFLMSQKYGDKDRLKLPPNTHVELIIGIEKTVWTCKISNPCRGEDTIDSFAGDIELVPISTPYAAGCGGDLAIGMIKYKLKVDKFITKDELRIMLETVGEISPGCDSNIDVLIGD